MGNFVSEHAFEARREWIKSIRQIHGDFADSTVHLQDALADEVDKNGLEALCNHLRLCGNIPEEYGYDTSEEKQYSKYTDALLSFAYKAIGLRSIVITERADVADVEAFAKDYSFVADAKAFRLSRTAKNQKDFKVQAMDAWKHGKPFAMVVCPIYQLPARSSQIYQQATVRNVCIFSYSHLAVLVRATEAIGQPNVENLLHRIFTSVPALQPTKDAASYWKAINGTMLGFDGRIQNLWMEEKQASLEAVAMGKNESLEYLSSERERIARMSHAEALQSLIDQSKIDNKIKTINSVGDNGLMEVT